MCRQDVDIAIKWAAIEGWNPGVYDAESYFIADHNGFFMGLLDGEPISVISAVKHGSTFGFIGFFIVKSTYRKQHYGSKIMNIALNYLKGRSVGCDSVVDQQHYYEKLGFKAFCRNVRFEGVGGITNPPALDIIEVSQLPIDIINTYDKHFFPDRRAEFMKSWVSQKGSYALGVIKNGRLLGFGVIRKCYVGFKIGPLFANDLEIAESIFLALKSKVQAKKPVFLDIPEVNHLALAMAERYNMKASFETVRMLNGDIPDMSLKNVFGITSFEVG